MPDQLDKFISAKPKSNPQIYAYSDPRYPEMFKTGITARSVSERMAEHYPAKSPDGKSRWDASLQKTQKDGLNPVAI